MVEASVVEVSARGSVTQVEARRAHLTRSGVVQDEVGQWQCVQARSGLGGTSVKDVPKANMDAPGTKGLVNNGRCKFACGFCEKVTGHQGSECWDEGGKRRVNFRWLFENGKCDGRGQPK